MMRAVLAVALLAMSALPVHAVTLGFFNLTNNQSNTGSQLSVDVTAVGSQVNFEFHNAGLGSIGEIYFDDGTLLGIASVTNGPGVSFVAGAANPGDLPGGNNANPDFNVTQGFLAEADGNNATGVQSGEQVSILFNLQGGQTFANTIAALTSGALRIGLHVRALNNGDSDSFVNSPVPEPATVFLMGFGLLGIGMWARRRLAHRVRTVVTT